MLMETNILSSIIIPCILVLFFYSIYSVNILKNRKKTIISLLLLITISMICYFTIENSLMNICIISILNMGIFKIFEKNNLIEYIFISLYFIFVKLLSYVTVTWFMNLISHEIIFPIDYTIYCSDILLFIFLICTTKLFKEYLSKIREYTIFYIMIHIVLILLYLSYLITIFKKGELPIESSIEILLVTLLVFLIYKMVNKVITIEKENYQVKLHNDELKFNQKNYDNIINSMNQIRKVKHDMNHILLLLLDYYDHNEYDELYNVLIQQLDLIKDTNYLINTGNPSLNFILSSYISKIQEENIEFISSTFDGDIHIDKIDFYMLLGNLLDNAIENCTSRSIRKILLDLYIEDDDLIIYLKNTCLHNPLLINPNFNTHKNDSNNHGFGMHTIDKIVKKYNGHIIYDYSYNYFIMNIKLNNKFSIK